MAEIKEALVPISVTTAISGNRGACRRRRHGQEGPGLVTLESDKATMEVPSSVAGVVKELKVKVGDSLSEGKVVALIEWLKAKRKPPPALPRRAGQGRCPGCRYPERAGRPQLPRLPAVVPLSAGAGHRRLRRHSGHRSPGRRWRHGQKDQGLVTLEATRPPWKCRPRWPVWSRRSRSRSATTCRRAMWLRSSRPRALPRRHRPRRRCRRACSR